MIGIQKELSLKEIKNEILKLENQLELYLNKKKINFDKTQPKASKVKELIVNSSNIIFDTFATYMIKDEQYDETIYALQESILAYKSYLNKELQRMSKYDDISLIVYLKEEENWNWKDIDKYLNCGGDYSRTKYKRYKKDSKKLN